MRQPLRKPSSSAPANRRRVEKPQKKQRFPYLLVLLVTAPLLWLLLRTPHNTTAATTAVAVPSPKITTQDDVVVPKTEERIEGVIEIGETVSASLQKRGVAKAEIARLVDALRREFDFRFTRAGDKYMLRLESTSGKILSFLYTRSPVESYLVLASESGELQSVRKDSAVSDEVLPFALTVDEQHPLFSQLANTTLRTQDQELVAELLVWLTNSIEGFHGELRFLLAQNSNPEAPSQVQVLSFSNKRLFRYVDTTGHSMYVTENGHLLEKHFLPAPIRYMTELEGQLTQACLSVVCLYWVPETTPVLALADGTLSRVEKRDNDYVVEIAHSAGRVSRYAGLSAVPQGLSKGMLLNQGRVLGYVSAEIPLELSLQQQELTIDPSHFLANQAASRIPLLDQKHFESFLQTQLAALAAVTIQ